jgi:hypothetical protein
MENLPSLTAATTFFEAHYRAAETGLDAGGLRWLHLKRRHTYAVLAAAERVVAGEPELAAAAPAEKRTWQLAALFHDLGRADEILALGGLSTANKIDHARASWETLRKHPEYGRMAEVALAAKYPSAPDLAALRNDPDFLAAPPDGQEKILRCARLTRDADKLANLDFQTFDAFRSVLESPENFPKGPLSADVRSSMAKRQLVRFHERRSLSDRIAHFAAWWFDINFNATRAALRAVDFHGAVARALVAAGEPDGARLADEWLGNGRR